MRQIIIAALMLVAFVVEAAKRYDIENDVFWRTTTDEPIYSQGGGIFRFPDAQGVEHFYWYGVHYSGAETYASSPTEKVEDTRFVSVTCYQSDDLLNWTFVNDVLVPSAFDGHGRPFWVGRLGVCYVPEAELYALFVQFNSNVLVATCPSPTGRFVWHDLIDMTDRIGTTNTGDQTVFTDEDTGKSYLVYSYGNGRNKIYLSEIGMKDGKITLLDCNKIFEGGGREGNCMFKYKGRYYVCASDLFGWNSSNVYYLEADDIHGPYMPVNDMQVMPGSADDYGHVTQTGFFYTVRGTKEETVVYCGDRWSDFAGNGNGYNQWCPITFEGGKPCFHSLSHWTINAETGEWKVLQRNNYAKNGSFEADRVGIPSAKKPVQDFLRGWTTEVTKGNKVAVGDTDSPVLNAANSPADRKSVVGNHSLNIADKTDFERRVFQTVNSTPRVPLRKGIYTLKAKAKGSAGFSLLYMYAKSGGKTYKADITATDGEWHTVTIENIKVKNGKVELGFYANGAANSWLHIDDVELTLK